MMNYGTSTSEWDNDVVISSRFYEFNTNYIMLLKNLIVHTLLRHLFQFKHWFTLNWIIDQVNGVP